MNIVASFSFFIRMKFFQRSSPIAARIATYDPPVGPAARAYVARHLADPAFRRWRAEGLIEESAHVNCDLDLPTRPWPHPG